MCADAHSASGGGCIGESGAEKDEGEGALSHFDTSIIPGIEHSRQRTAGTPLITALQLPAVRDGIRAGLETTSDLCALAQTCHACLTALRGETRAQRGALQQALRPSTQARRRPPQTVHTHRFGAAIAGRVASYLVRTSTQRSWRVLAVLDMPNGPLWDADEMERHPSWTKRCFCLQNGWQTVRACDISTWAAVETLYLRPSHSEHMKLAVIIQKSATEVRVVARSRLNIIRLFPADPNAKVVDVHLWSDRDADAAPVWPVMLAQPDLPWDASWMEEWLCERSVDHGEDADDASTGAGAGACSDDTVSVTDSV